MKFQTAITNINSGEEIIRGYALEDLIQKKTFAESIYLVLRGELPTDKEARMFNAILTAAIDHGPGTTSGMTARIVASAKNSLHTAVAAGILAMGELHGSAIEGAAKFFQTEKDNQDLLGLLKGYKEHHIRVPGYGHAILVDDKRATGLLAVAKDVGLFGVHCEMALAVADALGNLSSKKLPLNIDGAMAAILSDMGFSWIGIKGIFIIARVPGLVAHVSEEMVGDAGIRRLKEEDVEYTGPVAREVT